MKNTKNEFVTIGFNAYYWGEQEQNFLLAKCIGPLLRESDARWSPARLWYDRGTMRGPHIFGLLTVRGEDALKLQELLRSGISGFMEQHPSTHYLSGEQIAAFHKDAGGKAFCADDLREEMAGNNQLLVFVHEDAEQRYPFRLCCDSRAKAFWLACKNLAFWTLLRLDSSQPPELAAIHLLLACDYLLLGNQEWKKEYWSFHISTLIPHLDYRRMSSEHVNAIVDRLVSPESVARIAGWKQQMSHAADVAQPIQELLRMVSLLRPIISQPVARDQAMLREIIHVGLKQLGIYIVRQIPMIFTMAALGWPHPEYIAQ